MNNDPRFTLGWRVTIIVTLLLALATTQVKISAGSTNLTVGPGIGDQEREQSNKKRADQLEKRIEEMEKYLYDEVSLMVAAQKALKAKQPDSN